MKLLHEVCSFKRGGLTLPNKTHKVHFKGEDSLGGRVRVGHVYVREIDNAQTSESTVHQLHNCRGRDSGRKLNTTSSTCFVNSVKLQMTHDRVEGPTRPDGVTVRFVEK